MGDFRGKTESEGLLNVFGNPKFDDEVSGTKN